MVLRDKKSLPKGVGVVLWTLLDFGGSGLGSVIGDRTRTLRLERAAREDKLIHLEFGLGLGTFKPKAAGT